MAQKIESLEQITISGIPRTLVLKIDELAKRERRPRTKQVVRLLEEIVAKKESELQPA
jgi:metal-responsive CopG/Arc/MetJ family transcriptional regulator